MSSINASQSDGLKRLIDALFEESRTKAESAIYDAESRSRSILSESEKYSLKKAEETLSSYASMATIESRKEVSKAEIEARMSMLRMKSDYVERVFDAAKVHLLEYTGSKEYLSRLAKSIPAASERIDAGELLLSQRDIDALGAKLKRIAGKGVAVSHEHRDRRLHTRLERRQAVDRPDIGRHALLTEGEAARKNCRCTVQVIQMAIQGKIDKISGPVVQAEGVSGLEMHELTMVGDAELIGEVVRIEGTSATIQVYEETGGLKPGEKVVGSGMPLPSNSVGLLQTIYDAYSDRWTSSRILLATSSLGALRRLPSRVQRSGISFQPRRLATASSAGRSWEPYRKRLSSSTGYLCRRT